MVYGDGLENRCTLVVPGVRIPLPPFLEGDQNTRDAKHRYGGLPPKAPPSESPSLRFERQNRSKQSS